MSEQTRILASKRCSMENSRLSSATSCVLAALCCLLLLFYLGAQGRAITLMLRGFAVEEAPPTSGPATGAERDPM